VSEAQERRLRDGPAVSGGRIAIALLLGPGLLGGGVAVPAPEPAGPCTGLEAVLSSAAAALDKGQWADAERLLQPLSVSHGGCSGVLVGLARLRAAQNDPAEAERLFSRATTLAPDDALAHALFAQYALSRGQHARADYQSSLALALNPDCSEALVVQGQILRRKSRGLEARQALEKAVRLSPGDAEARFQLGIFYFRAKLHPEAAREFEGAVALRPLDARTHDYLALCLEALGQAEAAEVAYLGAQKVNEGPFFDSFLDYNYGRFLLKQNRLEESRLHLDRAVALLPGGRGPRYERAKLSLALKDYASARKDAELAQSLRDPGGLVLDLQVYYLLSAVYARLGESELARKYAELSRTTAIPDQAEDQRR
jgi:tetratricopeptide (TPR) repeat protein